MIQMGEKPKLTDPTLIAAFRGWNDGAEAASGVLDFLGQKWSARPFASIDGEEFFDFQVTRPTVSMVDGTTRRIDWPTTDFHHASTQGRDFVLVSGYEPNLRWRTFCDQVLGLAGEVGVKRVVTLGAFLADVPHTGPVPIAGASSDPLAIESLDAVPSRYEGPTGITGVLHSAAADRGLPSTTLWAAVPHYIPSGPNPAASRALISRLAALIQMPIGTDDLIQAEDRWKQQIEDLIASNAELSAYVDRLEEYTGTSHPLGPVPSGDELAAELEKFLRDQRGEDQ